MKIVLQNPAHGEVAVAEVPAPKLLPGCALVRVAASLVSAGTERASSEFASKNLAQKAKARPDLVQEVINKVKRDGLFSAVSAVRSRLDQPTALGYSSAGVVIGVADDVNDIRVGDRVACAGAGYAVHAEFACIPRLLLAKIPLQSKVELEEAAFTTVGAVALHGVRVADVKLGDTVVVIGLGLLGQLTAQILKAAGCRVLGMDINPDRAALAEKLGADAVGTLAEEFREVCSQRTNGRGVDSVLITAETPSSDPVNMAGAICRDRAIVTAVGTVGMDIERKQYYEKELDFRISRSYGPGRYDAAFEQKGRDYPIGYVRWTETRNMQAFLQLLADAKVHVKPLITHRFAVEQARGAYDLITTKTGEPSLGVLITYPLNADDSRQIEVGVPIARPVKSRSIKIGWIGAGAFANGILIPAAKQVAGLEFVGVCTANGAHSRQAAERFGFRYCTTDEQKIIDDPEVNAIVISTRHHLHSAQVLSGLRAGKHVFCEKPLCLSEQELAEIVRAYRPRASLLMVGFNRRFAPMALRMKSFLDGIQEPLSLHYRVNAGFIPADHWVNDVEQGGGRILGEVCHFVDFLIFLAGSHPVEVQTRSVSDIGQYSGDNVIVALQFLNGSQGTITYVANGDRSYSKERVEVFGGGTAAVLEDFRRLDLVSHGRKQTVRSRLRQDKGHRAEWEEFASAIKDGSESPIPLDELVATTLTTLGALESRSKGRPIVLEIARFIQANS